ncbi:MAG: Asp-tRNA(Asn)/Glu-tRNA(Gln) amidotransferase subunit GatB [Oscillospiraceae bacterium]|nr:Asp-tRNA(Asn)/Glu-tRNA(Gln) amidotransferase subunit GatB [Oscillospiraceae bacterium]
MSNTTFETVIGLEIHAELSTRSKIFCGCSNSFGAMPNTNVCPICSGMPGALPMLNRTVLEYAIRAGLALNCEIADRTVFDRKNYFYPDLPKAYQISQLYSPICTNGFMEIETNDYIKTIGIREIHMEEDAGKLIHDIANDSTLMDFNRCGVPLLEIVTNPDFNSSDEVIAFLEILRETLLYLDICDCKMEEGSLRVDVNLSMHLHGSELGTRTEMKNLNSFKAISRAIEFESARQQKILMAGGVVTQETRRWNDNIGISVAMRSKENAQDYRYFPEPDLLPIFIDEHWLEEIKTSQPELAHEKRIRYIDSYAISPNDAAILTTHMNISILFEALSSQSGEPIESARLIIGEILRLLSQSGTQADDLSIDVSKLSTLIDYVLSGKINRNVYKEAIEAVFTSDVDPVSYIEDKGLMMLDDYSTCQEAAKVVIANNPDAASDYLSGKDKAFGFLVGQTMQLLKGKGNPELVRKALEEELLLH